MYWRLGTLSLLSTFIFIDNCIAAPAASIVVSAVQTTGTPIAPCAFHFDATATTASGFNKPFHTLRYEWEFGDTNTETWQFGARASDQSSWSKNIDIGAVAGHLYESPGTYSVTLKVTAPDGTVDTETSSVTCGNPDEHFSNSQTYCFADISGRGGNFSDCPAGAQQVDSNDFDNALSSHCGANANTDRWCLFRKGDTFQQSAIAVLRNGGSGGLVSTFGTGAKPRIQVTGQSNSIQMGSNWIVSGLNIVGNGNCTAQFGCALIFAQHSEGSTVHDVEGSEVTRCYAGASQTGSSALVDFDCSIDPTPNTNLPSSVYLNTRKFLFLGNRIDGQYAPNSEFNLRYSTNPGDGGDKSVFAHSRLMRAAGQRNPLQIRGEHQYLQFHNNHLSTRNAREFIEVCENPGGCGNPNSESRDIIFEQNFCTIESGATDGQQQLMRFTASDWTARNNVLDIRGLAVGNGFSVCAQSPTNFGAAGSGACLNNTVYFDDANSSDITIMSGCATGSTHQVKGNLIYAPQNSGQDRLTDSNGCQTEANLFATSDPFDSQFSARAMSQFKIRNISSVVGAGANYSSTNDHGGVMDAFGNCPQTGMSWDIGAHQFSAPNCQSQTTDTTAPSAPSGLTVMLQ